MPKKQPKKQPKPQPCPRCGHDQYTVEHAGGTRTTFMMCNRCGNKMTPEAWKSGNERGDNLAFNLKKYRLAEDGVAMDPPSNKPSTPEYDPKTPSTWRRNKTERTRRKNPEDEKKHNNEEIGAGPMPYQASGDKEMGFNLKKAKNKIVQPKDGAVNHSESNSNFNLRTIKKASQAGCLQKVDVNDRNFVFNKARVGKTNKLIIDENTSPNVITSKSGPRPFNLKIAREFRWTDEQKFRKNDLGKNMVFPEGRQSKDGKEERANGNSSNSNEARRFDTVDRKDMERSPDPSDIVPGYEEWKNREVDQYYDGWLDDHIENSGGKVVGSNTPNTMNLNDEERAHAPIYPKEAITERLLQNRHQLADEIKSVISSNYFKMKKAQNDNTDQLTDQLIVDKLKEMENQNDSNYESFMLFILSKIDDVTKKEFIEAVDDSFFGKQKSETFTFSPPDRSEKPSSVWSSNQSTEITASEIDSDCDTCKNMGATCPDCANERTKKDADKTNSSKEASSGTIGKITPKTISFPASKESEVKIALDCCGGKPEIDHCDDCKKALAYVTEVKKK